jgi:hypothetical protein
MKTIHFFALLGLTAAVGAPRATAERSHHAAAIGSREEIRRDRQEIETFEEFMTVLDVSSRMQERKEYLKLNVELHEAMIREVEQAKTKAEWARRQPDAQRGYRRPTPEDRRDSSTASGRHLWLSDLAREAQDLIPGLVQWDPTALARNREVLGEFLEVMQVDLAASEEVVSGDPRL